MTPRIIWEPPLHVELWRDPDTRLVHYLGWESYYPNDGGAGDGSGDYVPSCNRGLFLGRRPAPPMPVGTWPTCLRCAALIVRHG